MGRSPKMFPHVRVLERWDVLKKFLTHEVCILRICEAHCEAHFMLFKLIDLLYVYQLSRCFSLKLCAWQNTRRIPSLQPKSGNVFFGFKDRALRLRLSLDHSRLLWPLRHVPCLWCGALCWGPHGSNEGYLERKPLRGTITNGRTLGWNPSLCGISCLLHLNSQSLAFIFLIFLKVFATDDFSEPKPEPYIWHLTKVCCSHKVSCLKSELGRNSLCSKTQKKGCFPMIFPRWLDVGGTHNMFTLHCANSEIAMDHRG